jgi:hypothetical protein
MVTKCVVKSVPNSCDARHQFVMEALCGWDGIIMTSSATYLGYVWGDLARCNAWCDL